MSIELPQDTPGNSPRTPKLPRTVARITLPSIREASENPDRILPRLEIATLDFMCALGLPHAENLDVARYFEWLDFAADRVDFATRENWDWFNRSPATFNNSVGYFCCYFLLRTLQLDLGVIYNPARRDDPCFQDPDCPHPDFSDSRDLFIHGIIDGPGGTCASMPVVYVAVGRRLGYPLRLVQTHGHLFFRWDDPLGRERGVPERFNIDGAGEGISSHPDEFYATWPKPLTDADKRYGWYLRSLTPAQELAAFLAKRGDCLVDNGRVAEAAQAFRWAANLTGQDPRYAQRACRLLGQRYVNPETAQHEEAELLLADRKRRKHGLSLAVAPYGDPVPPHGASCQCHHCREARQAAARIASETLHGGSCQCRECRVARDAAQTAGPMHWAGCPCADCQRSRSSRQDGGLSGHSPSCACAQCQLNRRGVPAALPFQPW